MTHFEKNTAEQLENSDRNRKEKNQIEVVQGYVDDGQLWKLQRNLVRETMSFYDTKSLNKRIARLGLGEITIRRIQGRYFLIEVLPDEELLEILKRNNWEYMKEYFIKIEH